MHDELMTAILAPANLQRAWQQVKANRGAPGVDGITVDDFPAYARKHWPTIRQQLEDGRYQPQPVKRVALPNRMGSNGCWAFPRSPTA